MLSGCVALVIQSRQRRAEGLLHWYSEEHVRAERGEMAREYKWPVPTPDGSGVYLKPKGRILFDLEWDRATESLARLRQKLNAYVGYYKHFSNARQHHVLFVVPSDDREDNVHYTIWQRRPHYTSDNCCSFGIRYPTSTISSSNPAWIAPRTRIGIVHQ